MGDWGEWSSYSEHLFGPLIRNASLGLGFEKRRGGKKRGADFSAPFVLYQAFRPEGCDPSGQRFMRS